MSCGKILHDFLYYLSLTQSRAAHSSFSNRRTFKPGLYSSTTYIFDRLAGRGVFIPFRHFQSLEIFCIGNILLYGFFLSGFEGGIISICIAGICTSTYLSMKEVGVVLS